MALPQLPDNRSAADYAQQGTEALGTELKRQRPLHPAVSHFWQKVLSGEMDPETAGVHARLGQMGHPGFQPPGGGLSGDEPGPIDPSRTPGAMPPGAQGPEYRTPQGPPGNESISYPNPTPYHGGPMLSGPAMDSPPTQEGLSGPAPAQGGFTEGDMPALQQTTGAMGVQRRTTREEREEKQTRDIEARSQRQERGIEGKGALQEQKDTAAGARREATNQNLIERTQMQIDARIKTARDSNAIAKERLADLRTKVDKGEATMNDAAMAKALAERMKVERANIASIRSEHANMLRAFTPPKAEQLKALHDAEEELSRLENDYTGFLEAVRKQYPSRVQVSPRTGTPKP